MIREESRWSASKQRWGRLLNVRSQGEKQEDLQSDVFLAQRGHDYCQYGSEANGLTIRK